MMKVLYAVAKHVETFVTQLPTSNVEQQCIGLIN